MTRTILIVDDDDEVRELLCAALESRGHGVAQAADLAQARGWLSEREPDLAVIDGFLPDGSGISFIQELRDAGRDFQVAFLSALWPDEAVLRRLTDELDVVRVLHKPMSVHSFLVQVESCFDDLDAEEETEELPRPEPTEETPPPPPPSQRAGREQLHARTARLRARYLEGLTDRLVELRETIADAEGPEDPEDTLMAAWELAERIRTSAVGFGFEELGRSAGELQGALWAALEGNTVLAEPLRGHLAQLEEQAAQARGQAQGGRSERDLWLARVLVADPDPQLIAQVQAAAAQMLVAVDVARDAHEAMDLARRQPPDLALVDMDLELPEGGLDLARRLRQLPELDGLPVGFLSRKGALTNRHRAADAGGAVFLTKPLQEGGFASAVRRLTGLSEGGAPRVLLVDDDPNFCRVLSAMVSRLGYKPTALSSGEQVMSALAELRPSLLVMDALMPRIGGLDLCRVVRASPAWDELPIIILTGLGGGDVVLAGLEAGADDVILKGTDAAELMARIRVRVERTRQLRLRSDRDPLTGLLHRRAFAEAAAARLDEGRREDRPLAIGMLRIPGLAGLVRARGAQAGDEVLATAAALIRGEFRSYDLRGRWTREFIVLLPGVGVSDAEAVFQRVCGRLNDLGFRASDGATFGIEARAGISAFPEDGRTLEDLVRWAMERAVGA